MRLHKLLSTLLLLGTGSAFGSIVFVGNVTLSGTGVGAVPTILTIQDSGNPNDDATGEGVSSGCVGRSGGSDITGSTACLGLSGLTGGEEKSGNQTQTRLLSDQQIVDLGITSLSNLGIVFNSSNQGNNDQVTLQQLMLSIYNGNDPVFAATLDTPKTVTGFTGKGKSGFLFALDDIQLQTAITATQGLDFGSLRIGLGATVSNDFAGSETFFAGYFDRNSNEPGEIPEPATTALVGLGLLGAVAAKRRYF